ncbi:MAG: leucine--tRNA ligase [Cyclobacteriaceae bacterium]
MGEYNREEIRRIENKWRNKWKEMNLYKVQDEFSKPKCYVLDMFPYPSGAGLHVGHPLGYIASDIYARFKRLKGFNVLHPMGFDAFGLPAEQFAIDHGINPAVSTRQNIETFKRQLGKIGFCYDWEREVQTCDPSYYRWTQWIFLQIFDSWFNRKNQKAERISDLVKIFETEGNINHPFPNEKNSFNEIREFSADQWKSYSEEDRLNILMNYRLAYLAYTDVNWCEALGTVLANDEVINGLSYRGGHPVVKKQMRQWSLRITEYADRLLKGLEEIDYSDSMKEIQRNWIGKSTGASIDFKLDSRDEVIRVFTTRPDTIFGVDFMVLAPEHNLVSKITIPAHHDEIAAYIKYVESRSDVDRMAEVKKVTGAFTGAYAVNPLSGKKIPVWISEYVLAGYGTGAIMGVPCGDERDHKFAKHFNLPVTNIIGDHYNGTEANPTKEAILQNSGFLDGMVMHKALHKSIEKLEELGVGKRKVNYKMHDAGWSRQRYWGEPFPVVFRNDVPFPMEEKDLPLELPETENFKSAGNGEGPLANLTDWIHFSKDEKRDSNTMPTHAGAAWYFLRYMDPHNNEVFADRKKLDYWNQVDVYIGGSEHAVAHLLYSRLWIKILHDLGYLSFDEPFKKLINQGKITGDSRFVYRVRGTHKFVSVGLKDQYPCDPLHVDVNIVSGLELDTEAFKKWKPDFASAEFILEDGKYICGSAIEKMSKSYFNVVNPDVIVDTYGADTLRLYEMFLGPLEMSKPWSTSGIDGVFKFLRKVWNLCHDNSGNLNISDVPPEAGELKVLHKTIRKVQHDIENFSFNTCVSEFMICANELNALKCNKRGIIEPLLIILAPFAPHMTDEIWEQLGHNDSIMNAPFPEFNEEYLKENSFEYPVSVNGKVRTKMEFPLDMAKEEIEKIVLTSEIVSKWTDGKAPKKIIVVPGRIINIVA